MSISSIANRFSLYELAAAYHARLEMVEQEFEKNIYITATNNVDTVMVATCGDTGEIFTVATALCSGSDVFNEDIGLELAYLRYQSGESVYMKAKEFGAFLRSLRD